MADTLLGEADRLYTAGKYVEAVSIYQQLANSAGCAAAGATAKDKLAEAMKDPHVRGIFEECVAIRQYQGAAALVLSKGASTTLPATATGPAEPKVTPAQVAALTDDQRQKVYLLLSNAARYPQSPTGQKAVGVLKQLESDKATKDTLAKWHEDAAAAHLQEAQGHQKANNPDQASECFRDIVAAHPGTKAAVQAKTALSQIQKTQ